MMEMINNKTKILINIQNNKLINIKTNSSHKKNKIYRALNDKSKKCKSHKVNQILSLKNWSKYFQLMNKFLQIFLIKISILTKIRLKILLYQWILMNHNGLKIKICAKLEYSNFSIKNKTQNHLLKFEIYYIFFV